MEGWSTNININSSQFAKIKNLQNFGNYAYQRYIYTNT